MCSLVGDSTITSFLFEGESPDFFAVGLVRGGLLSLVGVVIISKIPSVSRGLSTRFGNQTCSALVGSPWSNG